MENLGFRHERSASPGLPARLVLCNGSQIVDFHPVVFDDRGNGWQALGGDAWGLYPADALLGHGQIGEEAVACVTAELQVRHHLGYSPSEDDLRDIRALADAFDVVIPPGW